MAANDDFAGNRTTTGVLSSGVGTTGIFEAFRDEDWFKVTHTAGRYYTFGLATPVDARRSDYPTLTLYDAVGKEVFNPAMQVSAGGVSKTYKPALTGEYYIAAINQNSLQPGRAYTLAVTETLDNAGDSSRSALTVAAGQLIPGAFEFAGDSDSFKVTLEEGTSYTVTTSLSSALSKKVSVYLFAPDGSNAIKSGWVGRDEPLSFSSRAAGDYVIALWGSGAPAGAYSLRIDAAADDFRATAQGAGSLQPGSATSGSLEVMFDRDWFGADLQAGVTYWFTVSVGMLASAGNGGPAFVNQVRLLDSSGKQLAVLLDAKEAAQVLAYTPGESGRYYLEVGDTSARTGLYQVSVAVGPADDHGDTAATASALAAGLPMAGSLAIATDKDVFRLTAEAGKTYVIELAGRQIGAGAVPFLSIVTDDNRYLGAELRKFDKPGAASYLVLQAGATADYLLAVDNSTDIGTLSYALQVSVVEDAQGGSAAASGTLTSAATVHAGLDYVGDTDWFKVRFEPDRLYLFELGGAAAGDTLPEASIALIMRQFGAVFPLVKLPGNSAPIYSYRYSGTAAVDYQLEVKGLGSSMPVGTYSLTMTSSTRDSAGPELVWSGPANGASLAGSIVAVLNETVFGGGNAVLKDSAGVVLGSYRMAGDSHVSIVDNVVTVRPGLVLSADARYSLEFPANSIRDVWGNPSARDIVVGFSTVTTVAAGGSGNDYLAGHGSEGTLAGGAGMDTVIYPGIFSDYLVSRSGAEALVRLLAQASLPGDQLDSIERLQFKDKAIALDIDGSAGQAYRLYQAAFNRAPDKQGLGYWMQALDSGASLTSAAQAFIGSSEFAGLYGSVPSDQIFLNALYLNVLHRAPDAAGLQFWTQGLADGASRASVLAGFSESAENQAALLPLIGQGVEYTPYG